MTNSVPSTEIPTALCIECGFPYSQEDAQKACESCGYDRSAAAAETLSPDLAVRAPDGAVWIRADFDGQMDGSLQESAGTGSSTRSIYGFNFFRASFTNPQRVDGPPLALSPEEPPPLTQPFVKPAFVHFGADGSRITELTLHDLRVHRWEQVGLALAGTAGAEIVGRYRGTAYAAIMDQRSPPTESDAATPDEKAPTDGIDPSPTSPAGAPGTGRADAGLSEGSDVPCFYCRLWALLPLAVLAWYWCGWQEGLLGVLGVGLLSCWLARWYLPDKGSVLRKIASILPFLISLAGLWVFLGELSYTPCSSPYLWAALLPLAGLLLGSLFNRCLIRTLLFAMWLAVVYAHCARVHHACDAPLIGAGGPSGTGGSGAVGGGLPSLPDRVSQWLQGSAAVQHATDPQLAEEREDGVALQDALQKPDLLDDCRKKIRFPNAMLFEHNKADLRPELAAQLAEIGRLREHFPDRYLVVTGHTDGTGETSEVGHQHNLELSRQRADVVANWLSANTGWPLESIHSEGFGAAQPLVPLPDNLSTARFERNRRVEIGLNCKQQ